MNIIEISWEYYISIIIFVDEWLDVASSRYAGDGQSWKH